MEKTGTRDRMAEDGVVSQGRVSTTKDWMEVNVGIRNKINSISNIRTGSGVVSWNRIGTTKCRR